MTRRQRNPSLLSAAWRGARAGVSLYRAGRWERKATRARARAASFLRNPSIPGMVSEIRYRRTGALRGAYVHRFKPGVRMRANADGSVTLRGARRIHADDRMAGFWARYGHRNPSRLKRPSGTGWRKVASVTPGGKPFFWYRRTSAGREWIVWDRRTRQWRMSHETHASNPSLAYINKRLEAAGLYPVRSRHGARSVLRWRRLKVRATRALARQERVMTNPRRHRQRQAGGGDNTLLYLLLGGLAILYFRGTGSATGPGGYLLQPFAWWHNPQTGQTVLGGAEGLAPGAVPPWRLASEVEIQAASGPGP